MKFTRRNTMKLIGASALMATPQFALGQSSGTVHEVEMLNRNPETGDRMAFSPDLLQVNPGDTIRFVAKDRGHNSASDKNMLPAGAKGWSGRIGQDIEVQVTETGVYGYFCTPHRSVGMVGLILVGDVSAAQLAEAKAVRQRGKARDRFEGIFARAEAAISG